jgi:regulatory protein
MAARTSDRKSTKSNNKSDPVAARDVAVGLLARRDFSSGELRDRLQRKGFDPAATAAAVADLLEVRAVDDARYVENYVSRHAERGKGPVRIAADLAELGLPTELIDSALAAGSPDWGSRARETRVRRFGPHVPEAWAEKARQVRFLQYRGFSSDHIRSALDTDFDLD